MLYKVFDVSHGASYFMKSPTGKTELCDLGRQRDWSPLIHVYNNYILQGNKLDRLVLTHHHGDHVEDIDSLTSERKPKIVLRRNLTGRYKQACENSNSDTGQKNAKKFDDKFSTYTSSESISEKWGISWKHWSLTAAQANEEKDSEGGLVNCCSFVTLYDHEGTKILQCGDMEKEGMRRLLDNNSDMRDAVRGVDILITAHHGHKSGFSTSLMETIGKPQIAIASVMSNDANVDDRYSSDEYITGIKMNDGSTKRLFTTRSDGAISIESSGNGRFSLKCNKR